MGDGEWGMGEWEWGMGDGGLRDQEIRGFGIAYWILGIAYWTLRIGYRISVLRIDDCSWFRWHCC